MGEQVLQCNSGLRWFGDLTKGLNRERSCTIEPDISAVLVHFL